MSFRRLSRNAAASVVTVVLSALLLFELYRFLARELGPAQIGVWSIVMASTAVARLSEFGVGGGVVKFVATDMGAARPDRAAATIGMAFMGVGVFMGLICLGLLPLLAWLLPVVIREPAALADGLSLLPWALVSLWLITLANIFAGSLDGVQRSDLRAIAMVCAGVAQLLSAYWLVPQHGLLAMGPVQVIFAVTNLAGLLLATVLVLHQPLRAWSGWEMPRARELVRYGGGFQLAAFGQLLFEPSVKWLLGIFGGLTAAGYFELANRAVVQFRQVIAAAYQMLVPYFAHRLGAGTTSKEAARSAYVAATKTLLLIMVPWFTAVGIVLPMLLTFWLGEYVEAFVLVGAICLAGWAFNTLATPAFNLYLATGRLRWTIATQLTIGALNLVLGSLGGWLFGGTGVVVGAMLALALGSLVVITAFHREYAVPVRALFSPTVATMALVAVPAVMSAFWLAARWHGEAGIPLGWFAVLGLSMTAMLAVLWRDPMRQELFGRLSKT